MGLLSQTQIVPNLVNTANNVAAVIGTTDSGVVLGAPAATVVDLGAALGGSALALDASILPVVESPLASVPTDEGLGSILPADGLAIAVDLDTTALPAVNPTALLGGTEPVLAIDLGIADPIDPVPSLNTGLGEVVGSVLPTVSLDVGLTTGSAPEAAPVDPSAPATGGVAEPSPAPETPAEPSVPTGIGTSLEIDLGLGGGSGGGSTLPAAPSTGSDPFPADPAAPSTGGETEVPPAPDAPGIPSTPTGVGGSIEIDLGLGGGSGGGSHEIPPSVGGVDPVPSAPTGTGGVVEILPATGTGGPVFSGGGADPVGIPNAGSIGTEAGLATGGPNGGMSLAESIDWGHSDWVEGNAGNNTLMGLAGNDTLYGHGGDDTLYGNQNDDRLFGGQGNDILHGGRDNDYLSGDEGDDDLWGDYGDDILEGGDGADVFYFGLNSGNDKILDFNVDEGDRLDFQGQDYAIHEVAGSVVITLSGGGAVMLNGTSAAGLDAFIIG